MVGGGYVCSGSITCQALHSFACLYNCRFLFTFYHEIMLILTFTLTCAFLFSCLFSLVWFNKAFLCTCLCFTHVLVLWVYTRKNLLSLTQMNLHSIIHKAPSLTDVLRLVNFRRCNLLLPPTYHSPPPPPPPPPPPLCVIARQVLSHYL